MAIRSFKARDLGGRELVDESELRAPIVGHGEDLILSVDLDAIEIAVEGDRRVLACLADDPRRLVALALTHVLLAVLSPHMERDLAVAERSQHLGVVLGGPRIRRRLADGVAARLDGGRLSRSEGPNEAIEPVDEWKLRIAEELCLREGEKIDPMVGDRSGEAWVQRSIVGSGAHEGGASLSTVGLEEGTFENRHQEQTPGAAHSREGAGRSTKPPIGD